MMLLMPMTILMMVLTTMHLIDLSIRSFNDGVTTNDNIDDVVDNDAPVFQSVLFLCEDGAFFLICSRLLPGLSVRSR